MKPAEREDILLAITRLESRNGSVPSAESIATLLDRPLDEVQEDIQVLCSAGEIETAADDRFRLSESGQAAAAVVMKKHKVLETFLEEMLGMDREAAHQQACTLEHHASEETIARLNRFIGTSPPCVAGDREGVAPCHCRILTECAEGSHVCITAISGCGRAARLADLGLIAGEEVIIRRILAKTVLIQVKGSDIAISADIAKSILVGNCR